MSYSQKPGGIAAFVAAATLVFGLVLMTTAMAAMAAGELTTVESVAYLADNQTLYYVGNLVIYVLFGAVLVILSLALQERLATGSYALAKTATAFGLIWAGLVIASGMVANIGARSVVELYGKDPAQAGAMWLAIDSIRNGLGGGDEIVGGLWVLLVSVAALRAGGLPNALNWLGVVAGAAGVVTMVPPIGEAGGMIFGLGTIVWFIWVGVVMARGTGSAAV